MKRLTAFAVNHPGAVFLILAITTLVAGFGTLRIRMDSSTEALLPQGSRAYQMLQQTKRVFGDSKTFHITAIEPADTNRPFISAATLRQLRPLIEELETFRNFDLNTANKRLQALLDASGVTRKEEASQPDPAETRGGPPAGLDTGHLDTPPTLPGIETDSPTPTNTPTGDIWKQKLTRDIRLLTKPVRKRILYDYTGYQPVTLRQLKKKLDPVGQKLLDTVMIVSSRKIQDNTKPLGKKQFRALLENWETMHLHSSMEIIKTALDPFSAKDLQGQGDTLKSASLLPFANGRYTIPTTKQELAAYTNRLLKNPAYASLLYARTKDNKIAALSISLTMRPLPDATWIFNFIHQTIKKYNTKPLKLTQMGSYMYNKYLLQYMRADLKKLIPLVIMIIILTFYFNFRSLRGVLLPTLSVILSTTWTFGLMGLLDVPITLVVNLLPPLLIAVGSSYSIHILNQYRLQQNAILKDLDRKRATTTSMLSISLTVLLAALTTSIGFMTLTTNQMVSLKHFGFFAAIGTLFAMLSASLLLPATLTVLDRHKATPQENEDSTKGQHNRGIEKLVGKLSAISIRYPKRLIILALIVLVVFGYGISRLFVESSAAYMLKKSSFLYQADLHLGNLFEGHMITNLVLDSGKEGGALEPKFLKFIERFRKWVTGNQNKKQFHILHTASFGDVIKRIHMATHEDQPEWYRIPDKRSAIMDYLQLYGSRDSDGDGRPDALEQFIDPGKRFVNILIRKGSQGDRPLSTSRNAAGQEAISAWLRTNATPLGYTWEATGEPLTFVLLGKMVISGQLISVLLTLVLVALIIILLFKNWISGVLAVIPLTLSVVFVYGLMGFLKIPLDMPKAVLAAIAIGIGVDDTIHMLKTLRHNLIAGYSLEDSIKNTHREAGLAIVYTSIALIFGFSVFLFSEFVPVFYLGLFVALAMLATTLSALLILPAAACLLHRFNLKEEKPWRFLRKIKIAEYFDPPKK